MSAKHLIVPGVGVGDFRLGMRKDDVLKKLGKPESVYYAGDRHTLDNLPARYRLFYGHIELELHNDVVQKIKARDPSYKLTSGLGVGDAEEKITQAFGEDFDFSKTKREAYLDYGGEGVRFVVGKEDRTVTEITVYRAKPGPAPGMSPDLRPKLSGRDLKVYADVRGKDLRDCDLRNVGDILDTFEFDQETLWPPSERLPEGLAPQILLKAGMNPGLGVRALHAQGIIGAGVHVGLIDQPLDVGHDEYQERVLSYYAADFEPGTSSGHGPAMASLLAGKLCGTAPGAKLHVVAVPSWKGDAGHYARALDRFIEYNKDASKEEKIRVVSVSCQPSGEGSIFNNQPLWDEAVKRAQAEGILVLDCTWHHGFVSICWLAPKDRENVAACTPGFRGGAVEVDVGHIHVPAKPRSWARAPEDRRFGYAYDGGSRGTRRAKAKSGYSPAIPYAAGALALGWQIRPDLAPAQMKELLFESAHVHESGAKIIDPPAFIDLVRKQADSRPAQARSRVNSKIQCIAPCTGVGGFAIGMSKDEVLKKAGTPRSIYDLEEKDHLDDLSARIASGNLPTRYRMIYEGILFEIEDNTVQEIEVESPSYRLVCGVGVGDSEKEAKKALGSDFHLREEKDEVVLRYDGKGVRFVIDQKKRTVRDLRLYATGPMVFDRDIRAYRDARGKRTAMDLRGKDIRACDLRPAADILDNLIFDCETAWPRPQRLPEGFDPQTLMEEGMNPGLGIRALHAQGTTGAGIHVGMIDQPLFRYHPEYADGIVSYYYDADCDPHISSLHGPAMASQLVGKQCGTAPGALLHFAATPMWKHDASHFARALDRFVAYNQRVPKERRIRVASVSGAPSLFWNPHLWQKAVERAQAQGLLVLAGTYGSVSICWLDPGDRESVEACTPGFRNGPVEVEKGFIHVPAMPRVRAEAGDDGELGYLYIGGSRRRKPGDKGGYSACFPYAAGVLALGWQIRPELTPKQIMELLFESAHVHESGAKIINPTAFIKLVRKRSDHQAQLTRPPRDARRFVHPAFHTNRVPGR